MKKTIFLSFWLLFIASPIINAVTFKTISKTAYCLFGDDTEFLIYDETNYTIKLPIDDNYLKSIIEKKITTNFLDNSNLPFNDALDKYLYNDCYSEAASSVPEDAGMNTYNSLNGKVKSKSASLIVYECALLGGPSAGRGWCFMKYINYYIPQKKDLKVSDLILSSKTTKVINILRQKAKKFKATHHWGDEIHTKAINKLKISKDFYLSSKGITFVYQQFELGENRGYTVDLTIPKSQLTGCLTALGKKLIK